MGAKVVKELEATIPTPMPSEGPKANLRQLLAAISVHIGSLIMGTVWSWSSTALPSLRKETEDGFGIVTTTHEAWIASITFLAGAIGSPILGQMSQKVGLKASLIYVMAPLLIGWLLVTFAVNVVMLLIGRFVTGFFVAGVGVSAMLVSEYSDPSRRGRLNYLFDIIFCVGLLFIYVIGTFTPWRVQAGVCGGICIVFFVCLLRVHESPKCLVEKGHIEKARTALRYLRDSENVEGELSKIQKEVENEGNTRTNNVIEAGWRGYLKVYLSRESLKPIFLCVALQFFLQVCGAVPIICYAVDVFRAAGTTQINENVSTIVLGTINLIASCVAYLIVDKFGRRKLFIGSEFFLTVTLIAIGTFHFFKDFEKNSPLEDYSWFLLVCYAIYITAYSFGVGPLPWVLMGEIVSPQVKGISNGIINSAARIFGFLVMFYFNDMIDVVGQHGVYWFFASVCFSGIIFTYFFLPETRGRTLDEIQTDLQYTWHHNRKRPFN